MSWIFTKARRIRKARQTSKNSKVILERLRNYLDSEAAEPVRLLCGFWDDQQKAITYQELRQIVTQGWLDEETARLWEGDYAYFVKERMQKIWGDAMIAGSIAQPVMENALSVFQFNTQTPGVVEWMRSRGAYLVTSCTQTQKDAIALLLEDKMRNTHTVDELARLIRPTIGLTKPQTAAVRNYYDNLVKTLTEANPNRSVEDIKASALKKATQYAERQHRQRALTIAQTEMAYAYNYGADEGIRQAQGDYLIGKVEKRWCTSGDEQVCEECEKLDGEQIGMEERFFSGNKVEYDISGMYPPLHPRCACAVEYIEVEEPLSPATSLLQNADDPAIINPENRQMRQDGVGLSIPEQYNGDFSDFAPLALSEAESSVLAELNSLAVKTGHEYGAVFTGGKASEVFTSELRDRIHIPKEAIQSGKAGIYHSHTNCSPFSVKDLSWLLDENVETIAVISSNGDVYTATVGAGYIVSAEEFAAEAGAIQDGVDMELMLRPEFFDWSVEERKYMAIRETMYQIARQYGWTVRGGRL